MKVKDIDKRINETITKLENIKKILIKYEKINDNDNLSTIIYKKYLELESVQNVADYLNEKGYKVDSPTGGRKYQTNDVSKYFKERKYYNGLVEEELKEFVIKLFKNHKKRYM